MPICATSTSWNKVSCLSVYLSSYLASCLSSYLSVYLSLSLSIYLHVGLCDKYETDRHKGFRRIRAARNEVSYLCVHVSIYRSISLPAYLSMYLSIYLSIFRSICRYLRRIWNWPSQRFPADTSCAEQLVSYLQCKTSSQAVLGVWLPAPLPTPRTLPDHGAIWPFAVGVEKDLGGIDVWLCGIVCCSLCGLTHPPSIVQNC